MIDVLWAGAIVACVLVGLFFTFVSTVGVLRLPDVYSRAHTASQADTLGAGFALAAVALFLGRDPTAVKTVLLLFFIFVTNPTAAHAISRAAHEEGIVPWTREDDRSAAELAPDGGESDGASDARSGTSDASPGAAAGSSDDSAESSDDSAESGDDSDVSDAGSERGERR